MKPTSGPEFVHLHVHSEYSLLDGLARISDLMGRAKELGMGALALTDHGAMYAVLPFYEAATSQGIKPILGCEIYLALGSMDQKEARAESKPYHLILLARNEIGYRNLIALVTKSHLEGFYYKPRVDKETLAQYAQGLIALSACGSGEIPRLILEGRLQDARDAASRYRDMFGERGFYLELQDHGTEDLLTVNKELVAMGKELAIPLVATNDVHYVRAEDDKTHELLLCIQTNTTVNDPKRMRMHGSNYHLRSAEEMVEIFGELPEALGNTLEIAERCNLTFDFGRLHLPYYEVPPEFTADSYLEHLTRQGLKERYAEVTPEMEARLRHEADLIKKMGFSPYFLIVWDLIRFARERGILVGPGRGSAAGSMVAYVLKITDLDPLAHGLIFERFLNPGRLSMPDIDMDFPEDRRGEVIEYAVQKYGQDHVAQIITFGTMAARAAIRDAGRALDLPPGEVDRVAKLVPFGASIHEALESSPDLRSLYESQAYVHELMEAAKGLEGVARHASTHAAGVVITDEPLTNYVPLQRAIKGEGLITQYAMDDLVKIGLLKVDFLGLSTLTILRKTLDLMREGRGKELHLEGIDLNDPDIYNLLSEGSVVGVFQVESAGMRRVLRELQPTCFADVMAAIALYRPGPMKYIGDFIKRKHGEMEIDYLLPQLEPILRETYGIIVYQEQVIRIAMDLAGFSSSEADILREAIGKKKAEKLKQLRKKFVDGAVAKGMAKATANSIFETLEFFGRYGFNKSHAAAYAVITCQTAYFKAKYPVDYMTAFLSVEKGNTDRVALGISECRRLDIAVLPPDVNRSEWDFTVEGDSIRFGLGAIKNVGEGPVKAILAARGETPFSNLDDFVRRVDLRAVNRRALESLIRAGTLDGLARRSQLLEIVGQMLALSARAHQAQEMGQISIFDLGGVRSGPEENLLSLPELDEVPNREKLSWEKELLGLYISEHPLQWLAKELERDEVILCGRVDDSMADQKVTVAGMVASVRRITTKKGAPMAFARLEDAEGEIEVIVFPSIYEKTKELWQPDNLLLVSGKIKLDEEEIKLISDAVKEAKIGQSKVEQEIPAEPALTEPRFTHHMHITFPRSSNQEEDVRRLGRVHELLRSHKGEDRFSLYIPRGDKVLQLEFPNDTTGYTPELKRALVSLLGEGSLRVETISRDLR